MKGQTHGGKGSTPRPTNKRRFDENYEAIFNKTPSEGESQLDEGIHTPEADGRSGESKLREHVEGAGVQGQADQEQAIAWLITHHENQPVLTFNSSDYQSERFIKTPLYAHPPKREPLSDSVIERIIFDWDDAEEEMDLVEFARAIEAAHSITGDEHAK